MTKLIASISFCLLVLYTNATDDVSKIKEVVNKWNTLHNNGQPAKFKELYSKEVLFYGRIKSGIKCFETKRKFLSPEFHQEIISPIRIKYFNTGTIKCLFTKKVYYKKIIKTHASYLLLERKGDNYLITGESDNETDANLGVKLNLGEEIISQQNATRNYLLYGVSCIILTLTSVFIIRKRKAIRRDDSVEITPPELSQSFVTATRPAAVELEIVEEVKKVIREEMKDIMKDESPSKKGYDFEKYIIEKFDKQFFKVIEWRSDKFHQGHFALNSLLPDIELLFNSKYHQQKFAVECKWKAELFRGKFEVASSRQLETYRQYQVREGIPVFMILGLGGTASAPQNIFIIPLEEIQSTHLYESDLKKYYRHKTGKFFLQPEALILE